MEKDSKHSNEVLVQDTIWKETNKLIASDASNANWFSVSVAITNDGLVAMVSAWGKDTDGLTNNGQVYTYTTGIPA